MQSFAVTFAVTFASNMLYNMFLIFNISGNFGLFYHWLVATGGWLLAFGTNKNIAIILKKTYGFILH